MSPLENIADIPNGLLGIGESDSDYVFGDAVGIPQILPIEDAYIPKINQASALGGKLRSFCTGINALRIALSLDNKDMPLSLVEEYWAYAQANYGYKEGKGSYASNGINCARNFYNMKFPQTPIISFKINMLSPDHIKLLSQNYKTLVSYNGSTGYNQDYRADSILDGNSFDTRTYGHCTVQKSVSNKIYIDDSYDGTKYNIYQLKDLPGLLKNSIYYLPTYFFVRDPNNVLLSKQLSYEEEKKTALQRAKTRGVTNGDNLTQNDYRYLVWMYRLHK